MTQPMHPVATERCEVVRWVVPGYPLAALADQLHRSRPLRALLDDGTLTGVDVRADGVELHLAPALSWRREGAAVRTALTAALAQALPASGCLTGAGCAPAGCTSCPVSSLPRH